MQVGIFKDADAIAQYAADVIAQRWQREPAGVLGLATGSSPEPTYQALIAKQKAGEVSFAKARAFTLDEYVGLPAGHPESYREVIRNAFTRHVDFDDSAVQSPDGLATDPDAACARYEEAIKAAGGVDLQILGIGSNGHIAFNEPGESLVSRTHVGVLTSQTRQDNARFFDGDIDQVPTHCMTQGLGTIMEASKLLLIATGEGKAEAVHHLVEGAVSSSWPATIMQFHTDALVLIDEAAASRLETADRLRELWEAAHS